MTLDFRSSREVPTYSSHYPLHPSSLVPLVHPLFLGPACHPLPLPNHMNAFVVGASESASPVNVKPSVTTSSRGAEAREDLSEMHDAPRRKAEWGGGREAVQSASWKTDQKGRTEGERRFLEEGYRMPPFAETEAGERGGEPEEETVEEDEAACC